MNATASASLLFYIGWTLVHFVWQGILTAIILIVVLRLLRRQSPNTRYMVSSFTLFILACTPIITYLVLLTITQTPNRTPQATEVTIEIPDGVNHPNATVPVQDTAIPDSTLSTPETNESFRDAYLVLQQHLSLQFKPYLPGLVYFWIFGVLIFSLWRFVGWLGLQRLKTVYVSPVSDAVYERFHQLMLYMQISQSVELLESSIAEVPLTMGWLKPVIIIPTSVITGLSPDQLDCIIAHELAHIRRYDYLVNLFQCAVETVFFFHPCVWWISNTIRSERELCCDEIASKVTGGVFTYVKALAKLEEMRFYFAQLAMAASAGNVLFRIRYLLELPQSKTNIHHAMAVIPIALLCTVFFSFITQTTKLPVGIFDQCANIGNPFTPGAAEYDAETNTYKIMGQGHRKYGDTQDDLFYVYKEMEGDWSVEATIAVQDIVARDLHHIGLMCRESLDKEAKFVSTINLSGGVLSSSRQQKGVHTISVSSWGNRKDGEMRPIRCRMTRIAKDNLFIHEKYNSALQQWVVFNTSKVEMPENVLLGIFASSSSSQIDSKAHGVIQDLQLLTNVKYSETTKIHDPSTQDSITSIQPLHAFRMLPDIEYTPGKPVNIYLNLEGKPGICKIQEAPPKGWIIKNVSHNGVIKDGTITWSDISYPDIDTLSYTVTPSKTAYSEGYFWGRLNNENIRGMKQMALPQPIGIFENHMDLGFPSSLGSTEYDPQTGQYKIKGGQREGRYSMRIAYKKVTGDCRIAAKIRAVDIDSTFSWSGGGIAICDNMGYLNKVFSIKTYGDTDRISTIWFMGIKGLNWEEGVIIPPTLIEHQMEIERKGDMLSAYSVDPVTQKRTLHDQRILKMDETVYACIYSHSGEVGKYTLGYFSDVEVEEL